MAAKFAITKQCRSKLVGNLDGTCKSCNTNPKADVRVGSRLITVRVKLANWPLSKPRLSFEVNAELWPLDAKLRGIKIKVNQTIAQSNPT